MPTIDLRSDTVTQPDDAMRRAMAEARVGDDVYGEDPTVAELEAEAAERVGMESAMFVPSGTMGNQVALHLHTSRGDEVIADALSHVVHYEMGALAALSGAQPKLLWSDRGLLDPAAVEGAIVQGVPYQSRTSTVVVENTHNLAGGTVYELSRLRKIVEVAKRRGLKLHLDGARLWNAAAALDCDAARITEGFDSVSFCLSKGLGAPVGSLLCGRSDWIVAARRVRKMLGGGMRQVGVLAAAGLLALREGPARLIGDHVNAARLAAGLSIIDGLELEGGPPETNIVVCRLTATSAADFISRLGERDVLAIPLVGERLRFVTHRDVDSGQIEVAIEAAAAALAGAD